MRGLPLTVVNIGPALSRLENESLGIAVAGLGHAIHGRTVSLRCTTYATNWDMSVYDGNPDQVAILVLSWRPEATAEAVTLTIDWLLGNENKIQPWTVPDDETRVR